MADDEQSRSDSVPALVQEFMAQLRAVAEQAEGLRPAWPASPGAVTLPGGLSAAQMAAITDSIAAQRRSIEALKTQLSSFDEQLAMLESILGPLAQWTKTWADLEQRLLNLGPGPETGG
jgi:small-conductance mechanosensitive channel